MKYTTLLIILLYSPLSAQPFPSSLVGPDAPEMTITWGPSGFTFDLFDPPGSNNEQMWYAEFFQQQPEPPDPLFRSQGHMVFRLLFDPSEDPWPAGLTLPEIVIDSSFALPVVVADKVDTVIMAYDLLMDCTPLSWQLPNSGLSASYSVLTDPLTGLPFEADQEYCFVAVSFATNPYCWSDSCNAVDQLIIGRHAAFGAIQPQCVTGSQLVGIAESDARSFKVTYDPATEHLLMLDVPDGSFSVRCTDPTGRVVYDTSRSMINVSSWPSGVYHVILNTGLRYMTASVCIDR
jgi:hypothetical protein